MTELSATPSPAEPQPGTREICPKCQGTGRFVSYAGRDCGPCFTCHGNGYKTEERRWYGYHARRLGRATAREQLAAAGTEASASVEAFRATNPDIVAWLERNAPTFEFAASLLNQLRRRGGLTENQLAAVLRGIERDEAREAAPAAQAPVAASAAPPAAIEIDTSRLFACLTAAAATGLRRPRLIVGDVTVKLAGSTSRQPGALYFYSNGTFLGSIRPAGAALIVSRAYRGLSEQDREAFVTAVRELAADPVARVRAHGGLTGQCSCCGRPLSDPVSVANGIGPICADRFGFSF